MSQIIGILTTLIILGLLFHLLRQGKLRERHAVWWIIGALISLVLALFPSLLEILSKQLGITIPINLVFFVAIGTLFFGYLQTSSELTKLEEKVRALAEEVAILSIEKSQKKSSKK